MAEARLIGIDWGTTTFRAALMDGEGRILDKVASGEGLLAVADRAFEAVLERALQPWDAGRRLPAIASGMVTSRSWVAWVALGNSLIMTWARIRRRS